MKAGASEFKHDVVRYDDLDDFLFLEDEARPGCFGAIRSLGPRVRSRISSTCSSLLSAIPRKRSQSVVGAVFEAKQRQFSRKIPLTGCPAPYQQPLTRDSFELYERRRSSLYSEEEFLRDMGFIFAADEQEK